MNDSDDLMIRPSPGVKGAIRCGMCGNLDLRVFINAEQKIIRVVIFCPVCGNRMEYTHDVDSSR